MQINGRVHLFNNQLRPAGSQLHGAFVLAYPSDGPGVSLASVATAAALKAPGVVRVVTAADLASDKQVQVAYGISTSWAVGQLGSWAAGSR
jgi:hypothetical protein